MTLEEYNQALKQLEYNHQVSKSKLMRMFVDANNPYKPGDKVTDHIGTIIIENMGYYWGFTKPCAYYEGIELKKDGTPKKRESRRTVYQSNIK